MFSFFQLPKNWLLVLLAALLALFGWGCLFGCNTATTNQQVKMFDETLQSRINGLKAAGVHGWLGAGLFVDQLGSMETAIRGPGTLVVLAFVEVDPTAPDALEYPTTQPAPE